MGNMANETSDVDLCVHYKTQPKIEDHLKMKKELKNKHGK